MRPGSKREPGVEIHDNRIYIRLGIQLHLDDVGSDSEPQELTEPIDDEEGGETVDL